MTWIADPNNLVGSSAVGAVKGSLATATMATFLTFTGASGMDFGSPQVAISIVQANDGHSVSTVCLDRSDIEYLESIADVVKDMRTFQETSSEARGCPDPEFYADEEDWDV